MPQNVRSDANRRAAEKRAALRSREEDYLCWLMHARSYTLLQAKAYATGGQQALAKLNRSQSAPKAATARERAEAYRNDQPEDVKRWARVDAACPRKGCTLPVNHSGPHKRASPLMEMLENSIVQLDERERDESQ
jgi:hypothetical protein